MVQENKAVQLKKFMVQIAPQVDLGEKDYAQLVEICSLYQVDPATLHGALYSFYLLVFDKETCVNNVQDKGKTMDGLAKAMAGMTIGLVAGIDVPISKAMNDVLLTAVDRDMIEPDCVTIILGSKGELNHYINMVKMVLTNMRRELGDTGY